jgi:prepilin-type N-terminal cleavage/methylation domain-containing protein/prepilin-type processing-associated H-X9-DG protein
LRAFTLIELLVVIAIIALLIAILLPSLAKARDRAKLIVCQTHMRAWGLGFHLYASDYNNALPLDGGDGTTSKPIGQWNDPFLWFNGVTNYMGEGTESYDQLQLSAAPSYHGLPKSGANSVFVCPLAVDVASAAGSKDVVANGFFQTVGWYTTKPSPFVETRPMLLCYGMNSQLRSWDLSNWEDYPGIPQTGDISKMTMLTPAGMVPLLAEKRIRADEIPTNDPNYTEALTQNKVTANRFSARHSKGGNIVFADDHVEWFSNFDVNKNASTSTNYYNWPGVIYWNPTSANY